MHIDLDFDYAPDSHLEMQYEDRNGCPYSDVDTTDINWDVDEDQEDWEQEYYAPLCESIQGNGWTSSEDWGNDWSRE